MIRWADELSGILHRHPAVILVTVTETKGSVPREVGTQMLISNNETVGTIGGGNLEFQCMTLARQRLKNEHDWPDTTLRLPLGPSLGQCCGGLVIVSLRYIDQPNPNIFTEDTSKPALEIVLFGAGHVGQAVVKTLADIDCIVTWIDNREDAFPSIIPTHIKKVISDYPEDEVQSTPTTSCFLIMTHDHQLDQRICESILNRGGFLYCGLIGSLSKRRKFEQRLLSKGYSTSDLSKLTCPIGIAEISGKEPAIIAVSVVAQLLKIISHQNQSSQ